MGYNGTTKGGMLYGGENQKMNTATKSLDRISRVSKNFKIIAERMVEDDDLVRLLIDNREECLEEDEKIVIENQQKKDALKHNITLVPVIDKSKEDDTRIVMGIKDIINDDAKYIYTLDFDVVVNVDNWKLTNYNLRPLALINEIDNLFTDTKMCGIGAAKFIGVESIKVNERLGGFRAHYLIEDI